MNVNSRVFVFVQFVGCALAGGLTVIFMVIARVSFSVIKKLFHIANC